MNNILAISLIIIALSSGLAIGIYIGIPEHLTIEIDYSDDVTENMEWMRNYTVNITEEPKDDWNETRFKEWYDNRFNTTFHNYSHSTQKENGGK